MATSHRVSVGVLATPGATALDCLPSTRDEVEVHVLHPDTDPAVLARTEAVVWVPDFKTAGSRTAGFATSESFSELFPRLPNLRWIHSFAAGVDGLTGFLDQTLRPAVHGGRNVVMTNARGAFSDALAEYAVAACLHFAKQLATREAHRKAKAWEVQYTRWLKGSTVGLLGYGSIGQATARLLKPFGVRILALKTAPAECDGMADEVLGWSDRHRVFSEADYLICSLPHTQDTIHAIGRAELAACPPSAVFVNLGRGSNVDEPALIEALQQGKLAGAALDVFAQEPLPADSPIWDLGNVLITAHCACLTNDYDQHSWSVWEENLDRFVHGKPLATCVDIEKGY